MNILLINPSCGFNAMSQAAPLGLLSIATYLKQRGYHVRVYDRNVDRTPLKKVMRDFSPDIAGVSAAILTQAHDSLAVSRRLRAAGIPVVWGGPSASAEPEMILLEGAADYVVIGEGEITLHELVQALEHKSDIAQVKDIAYLDKTGAICRTPQRDFADLADFPVIDWSFVNPRHYLNPSVFCAKMAWLYCSKGCPGRCAFCYNPVFNRCTYRKRPNEYVVREIEELATKHGMGGVCFADDMLGANKRDLYDLCDRIRDLKLDLTWGCQTRLCHLSREDLQYMYDAGCRLLYYGLESGSPEMLKRMRKGTDLEKMKMELDFCREIGIITFGSFIIGLPDETEEQLRETVRLMLHPGLDMFQVFMFIPIPGTEFYRDLEESGRLVPYQTLREYGRYVMIGGRANNYSNVPTRDLRVLQSFFLWRTVFSKNAAKVSSRQSFAREASIGVLRGIFRQGFFGAIKYAFAAARRFLTILWYRFAYPGILRKYGLKQSETAK